MATSDIEYLAHQVVALQRAQSAAARATQLPSTSVRLVDGTDAYITDGLETANDLVTDVGMLHDQTESVTDLADEMIDYSNDEDEWRETLAEMGTIAWDGSEYAIDLANELEIALDKAKADLEQAQLDLTAANDKLATMENELAAASQDIANAQGDITAAKELAERKSTVHYKPSTEAPPLTGNTIGDTWFVTDDSNKIKTWDGTNWIDKALGTNAFADLAITNAKIATLDAAKITTGFLNADRIEALSIVGGKIAANSISTDKLVANAVTAEKIAASAITAREIAARTITADKIVANSITGNEIKALSITGDEIVANAITGDKIQANAIDGMTITGALIRTAPSGQRMQMDINGLRSFNNADALTAAISADSGGLLLTGTLTNYEGGNNSRARLSSGELKFDLPGSPGAASATYGPGYITASGTEARFSITNLTGGTSSGIDIYSAGNINLGTPTLNSSRDLKALWTGAWFVGASQTVNFRERLSAQVNGIILEFKRYTGGAAANEQMFYAHIPKSHGANYAGRGVMVNVPTWDSANSGKSPEFKYFYVSDTHLTGHAANSTGLAANHVLTAVYGY